MKARHAWPSAALALSLLLLADHTDARAQGRDPLPHRAPPPTKPNRRPHPPGIHERQRIMLEMEEEMSRGGRPKPSKSPDDLMAEVADDYRDLQRVNNRMMGAAMGADAPDYKLIARSTAEIVRRAERLRANLMLPEPEAAPEAKEQRRLAQAEDAAGMKAALLALDRAVMSFVGSPVFKNTDVVDAKAAAKAGRDLAEVIERGRLAGEDAERLGKKSAKP